MIATATKFDVRFSITARQDKRIRAAIDAIDEAGPDLQRATAATLRRKVFTMPGRLVQQRPATISTADSASWPWADPISSALASIHAIPLRC